MNEERLKKYRELKKELATIEGLKREVDSLRGVTRGGHSVSARRARSAEMEVATAETAEEVIESKRADLLREILSVEEGIAQLPPLTRAVLRMHYIEGLPFWKIANKLNYSERTVRRIRDNALKR